MPRGDKSAYTAKQKRQAEHIEEGYLARGVPEKEAERRAWATENKMSGGGRKSGAGRGKKTNKAPARERRADRRAGLGVAPQIGAVASARKAAATRKRRAGAGKHKARRRG